MLKVDKLSKSYGKFMANEEISFHLPRGTVALLAGPNGAGKSTLMKSIVGLLKHTGTVHIAGLSNKSIEAKSILGYVPEFPQLYPFLTVFEHLEFTARVHKLKEAKPRALDLLKRFDLMPHKDKLSGALSKGMQQKVSICCALLHDPLFLVFDEPMIGLDPHAIKTLKEVFQEQARLGKTLLISTHILDTVDELWDQLLVMQGAKLVANARQSEILAKGQSLEDFFFEVTQDEEA